MLKLSQLVSLCLSVSFSIRATAINQARASTLRVCNDQKRSRLTAPMCTEVSSSSMAGLSMATLHALTQRLSTLKRTSKKLTAPKQLFLFFENKSSSFFSLFYIYIKCSLSLSFFFFFLTLSHSLPNTVWLSTKWLQPFKPLSKTAERDPKLTASGKVPVAQI